MKRSLIFLTSILFFSLIGISCLYIAPESLGQYIPFQKSDLVALFSGVTLAISGVMPDGGLYNEKAGLFGTVARDSASLYRVGGKVAIGRVPFGFGIALVADGEGISVVGADAVVDKLESGSGNAGLRILTKAIATWVRFAIVNPGTNNAALALTLEGEGTQDDPYVITVSTATNGSAQITSTASLVKTALEADANINAIIAVELLGTGGSAVVAQAEAPLTKSIADLRFDGVAAQSSAGGDLENGAYHDSQLATFINKGNVFVPCEEATKELDTVRIRLVTEGANLAGQFRKTAIVGITAVIKGVKFGSQQETGAAELDLSSGFYELTLDV